VNRAIDHRRPAIEDDLPSFMSPLRIDSALIFTGDISVSLI
jgi:hypothetical protein